MTERWGKTVHSFTSAVFLFLWLQIKVDSSRFRFGWFAQIIKKQNLKTEKIIKQIWRVLLGNHRTHKFIIHYYQTFLFSLTQEQLSQWQKKWRTWSSIQSVNNSLWMDFKCCVYMFYQYWQDTLMLFEYRGYIIILNFTWRINIAFLILTHLSPVTAQCSQTTKHCALDECVL